jgi:hypothetical protein
MGWLSPLIKAFMEEQIPRCDDPGVLKELKRLKVFNTDFVAKVRAKIREEYPNIADD